MKLRILILAALPVVAFTSSACSMATMSIDPVLAARAEPMPVTGANPRVWNRPLAFGPFSTEQVQEGGEWRWAAPILGGEAGIAWQNHRMVLVDGEARTQTACRARRVFFERDGWSVDPALGRLPVLQCVLRDDEGGEPWTLTLHRTPRNTLAGTIEHDRDTIQVVSEHRADGGMVDTAEPVGYSLFVEGSAIAAIETVNRGRVWIDPKLSASDRTAVASAAAALLLFDPSEDD